MGSHGSDERGVGDWGIYIPSNDITRFRYINDIFMESQVGAPKNSPR